MQIVKPTRIRHQHTQSLTAPPERVFPLLCPVRETDWAPGWAPSRVVSESGVMEEHCLFTTPEEDGAEAVWINTRHDNETLSLELWKIIPERAVCQLDIRLTAAMGGGSDATITYTCTSLGPSGDEFLEGFTGEWYEAFMRYWEDSLNFYLEHGTMIPAEQLG
jgi:hypothetical protein